MDLSSINKTTGLNNKNVAFQGQKTVKNNSGESRLRIVPPYIELGENEELGIELVKLSNINDERGYDWRITSPKPIRIKTDDEFKTGAKTYFDVDLKSKWLDKSGEVGYRFVVYDKNNVNEVKRAYTDSVGSVIGDENIGEFTVASTRQGTPQNAGPMEHIFTDSYNVIHKAVPKNAGPGNYDEVVGKFRRNHFNKAGGTIRGIIEKLGTDLSANKLIMTTPLIGGGKVSPHMYHPANSFQISDGTGTKQDFLDLQVECFKKGKGYVLDGAFTSQGFEGLHFNHAMKHEDSPNKFWFKNPSDNGYQLAILSDVDNAHTGMRVVNPMGVKGYNYDPTMPTYIQLYDTRLTGKDQLSDYGSLIEEYENKGTEDPYEITNRQDSVLCNYFEVDPASPQYKGKTFGPLSEWNKGDVDALAPQNRCFKIERTGEAGGYTGWDGNMDLVKMNLSNHSSSKDLIQGCNQARNYMYNVARYWTEETRNALIMDIAQEVYNRRINESKNQDAPTKAVLKYLDDIEERFPLRIEKKGTLADIYTRVMKEKRAYEHEGVPVPKSYDYNIYDDKRDPRTFLREEILNFPLESLNFSPELLAVLSSPYITPRPSAEGDPASSKAEIFEDAINNSGLSKTMQNVYTQSLPAAIKRIMYVIEQEQINDKNDKFGLKKLFFANGDSLDEITPYGKYFLEMAMDDIMQFLITESLFDEDTYPVYKDGKLDYTYADKELGTKGNGKRLTLNRLGIYDANSKEEAEKVAKKLSKGLDNLETKKPKEFAEFINYLSERYFKLDPEDYKIAEAVVDKTGAGLNWRFDAAKDVGDWDEAAKKQITSADVWDDVISFWKPFVKEVRDINPSSYIVAEVTSLHDFDKYDWGKYGNADKAEKAYYQEVGATTGSNYSTYFGLYPKLFGKNIEEGNVENYRSISNFLKKTQDFIKPGSDGHVSSEFILGSHIFLDNHDKPRAAHLMGVDAALFWSDFQRNGELIPEYVQRAEKVLQREYDDNMDSKAVAVAEQYMNYFGKRSDELGISKDNKKIINDAISHLANGYKYKDKDDATPSQKRADAFGQTPFEITIPHVIEQAEVMGAKLSKSEKRALAENVRADMVSPYISKMTAIYELMSGTVGIPTIFAGDEYAQTGSETKSKNTALGCRNITRHDFIEGNTKEDVLEFNSRLKSVGMLSKKSGMSALANGTPIVIMPKEADYLKNTTKDELITALKNVGHNNFDDLKGSCGFLDCVKSGSAEFEEIISALESMSEDDIKTNLRAQLKTVHPGMADWVKTNIAKETKAQSDKTETGAIYKYNDKGEGVITMVTNAYIPEDVSEISPLKTSLKDGIEAPKVSSVTLKDSNGNLIAKPGTEFIRKTYSEQAGDYIDNGVFTLTKNGVLVSKDGKEATLDSTVTYFSKQKPIVYTSYTKLIG